MDHRKLHKTIEIIASKKYKNDKLMLLSILTELIDFGDLRIQGAVLWSLDEKKQVYTPDESIGNIVSIDKIRPIYLDECGILERVVYERTVLSDEIVCNILNVNELQVPILGVGDKIKLESGVYYEILITLSCVEFNEDIRFALNMIATALASKLQQGRIGASEEHLKREIDKAKQLQKSILPDHDFSFRGYEIFGITIPAELIGGDFFDYLYVGDDDERVGIVVGDVASHGLSAAAEAMYISGAVRMASTFQIKIATLLKRMNQLVNKIFDDDKFSTLFYGEISNNNNGLFLYANAGHNPPIFISAETGQMSYLKPTGPALGPTKNARYDTEHLNFKVGDVLLIYSDGITEANDENYNFFGEQKLEQILKRKMHLTPRDICYSIIDEVMKFSVNHRFNDDKTIVVIKRNQ